MYAITGITGQIGGAVGRTLLAAGKPVRAVVRDVDKGKSWTERGCDLALATIEDAASLTAAFRGAEGVFVLVPPNFDPQPGFPEAQAIAAGLRSALDKPVSMVATADIGKLAAALLQEPWSGHCIVELEGPRRVTPDEIAATFTKVLGRPVRAKIVPRDSWEGLFSSQGMKNPLPRILMLDGFNEGWIEFERDEAGSQKGTTSLESVLRSLLDEKLT